MVADNSCDIILCALVLHYIEDWDFTMKEFYRVLKTNGTLVISIEHPFYDYTFFKSKIYFNVENVKCTWKSFGRPIEANSFRRPLNECITSLTENGFLIDLSPVLKEKIREKPDNYVLFGNSEDGLEVSLKDPDLHT